MSGWFKILRSEEAMTLQERHPNAMLLLLQIAHRARWKPEPCPFTGLKFGQAMIGDFKAAGIQSEKAYRCAKDTLERGGLAAFKGANKGTIATLTSSMIVAIADDAKGEQRADGGASQGRTRGGQGATNIEGKKDRREDEDLFPAEAGAREEAIYQAYPRKKSKPDALKAIRKALKAKPFDWLLERTKSYATSVAGKEPQFIPYPATWFNGHQYNDEDEKPSGARLDMEGDARFQASNA